MDHQKVKRKLAAIFSADVKGYSRLMADNDVETVKAIKACRELLFQKISDHRGRVADFPGDNILSEFSSVTDAVACAAEIQNSLAGFNKGLSRDRKMEFRVGINLGDIIEDEDRIYGDGINIAARLESMAEPGGICISGSAYDQVKNKLAFGYEFLGIKHLKNISDPVRVYTVLTEPAAAGTLRYRNLKDDPRHRRNKRLAAAVIILLLAGGGLFLHNRLNLPFLPAGHLKTVALKAKELKIPDKPSIAVLPFLNMSGDREQEYFSDGLTEDLITDLSKVSGLFVIARNSVFFYKGKNFKVGDIGRELGVKYLLEGSVRKMGERVRINAQLIDSKTGGHVWADRYDRDLNDIFTLQDEVRQKIVTALAVRMTSEDLKRTRMKDTENPAAYDYYLRAGNLCKSTDLTHLADGRELLREAIRLDPGFAKAYAAMGKTYFGQWIFGPEKDPATLRQVYEWGQKAKAVNPEEPLGYDQVALFYLWTKQHDAAIEEIRKAIALAPNHAELLANYGDILTYAGYPKKGIPYIEQAMRLDPKFPVWYEYGLGHAYFLTQDYDKAIAAFQGAVEQDPRFWPSFMLLAVCYDAKGMKEAAKKAAQTALAINKDLPYENWETRIPYKDPRVLDKVGAALKNVGIYH